MFMTGESMGVLGSGAHGVVRMAQHVATGEMVAIKVLAIGSRGPLAQVAKELAAQGSIHHPHVVELRETLCDLDRHHVFMVMELCRGGELFDRIAECGSLDQECAQRYLYQLSSALAACHAANIYHRDLKPENVLLSADGDVKIADFGLSVVMMCVVGEDSSFLQHTKCGSMMYAAPEILASTAVRGYSAAKSDVWSLGIMLYAMLKGRLPFIVADVNRCPRFAVLVRYGFPGLVEVIKSSTNDPRPFSPEAAALLARMLDPDPDTRADIAQVLLSSYLTEQPRPTRQSSPGVDSKWCELITPPEVSYAAVSYAAAPCRVASDISDVSDISDISPAASFPAAPPTMLAAPTAVLPPAVIANSCTKRKLHEAPVGALPAVESPGTSTGKSVAPLPSSAAGSPRTILPIARHSQLIEGDTAVDGVNTMLNRTLGWVSMPAEKESMIAEVTSALDTLGVKYHVMQGELSSIVEVSGGESSGEAEVAGVHMEGQLTVQMRVLARGDVSDLHIARQRGSVLQFHSFYRDVRNELAGMNGWSKELGQYRRINAIAAGSGNAMPPVSEVSEVRTLA